MQGESPEGANPPGTPEGGEPAGGLQPADAAFVALLEAMPDPIVLQRGGRFVFVNRPFLTMMGYGSPGELLGRSVLELVHPDDVAYVRHVLSTPHPGRLGNVTAEHRLVRRDGQAIPVEVIMLIVPYEGRVTPLGFVRDLSERRQLEAQLLTADRMASLGRLSASIGHEINNPLAYTQGALELLQREVDDLGRRDEAGAARLRPWLATAREGVDRVQAVVHHMKALSRGETGEQVAVDIVAVLDQCAAVADPEIRRRARLVRRYDPVPPVVGNEARIGQVFLNLLVNAAEAIPEGVVEANTITLAVRAEGEAVVVDIEDTGVGVAPEARGRLFEPFFTTKGARSGSGLGLSISHHIVTTMGGTIAVAPASARGTRFRVTLPAGGQPATPTPAKPPAAHASSSKRILLVDDEPLLLKVLAARLSAHEVTAVGGGRAALELLRSGARFDAVLCDLHTDDVSGMDLHDHVLREFPELADRIVFMTGGAMSAPARAFVAATGRLVLNKPFQGADVDAALHAVFGRS